jgi:predicted Zn-dependent protease
MGAMLGGASMAERRFLSFSRMQEENADDSALKTLDKLGWSAQGMLDLLERLEQEEALSTDRMDPYLITHPLTQDRIAFVRHHVEESRGRTHALPAEVETRFQMVKAKLDGFLDAPWDVTRRYKPDDPSPPARYALAIGQHRMGHSGQAVALLDGLIRQQPQSPWLYELKGQVLFESGNLSSAIPSYQEAVRLAPDQALPRQGLGQAMIETEDKNLLPEAIAQLKLAQRHEPDDPTTWHLLGVAFGRMGDMGEANLALAEEAMLENDVGAARRFARQALTTLPPGPSKLRALDISNAVKKENRS